MAAGITCKSTMAALKIPYRTTRINWLPSTTTAAMATPDPLSRWLLSQIRPLILDSVPGIDPGTLPDPFPGATPEPDPDPDPLPPSEPGTPGADPGFPVEPLPSPEPLTAKRCA